MENATWVIAAASLVNLLVLVAYAFFTWGIWRETQRSGERTEVLVREAIEGFKFRVLATYLDYLRYLDSGEQAMQMLKAAFPEQHEQIELICTGARKR